MAKAPCPLPNTDKHAFIILVRMEKKGVNFNSARVLEHLQCMGVFYATGIPR